MTPKLSSSARFSKRKFLWTLGYEDSVTTEIGTFHKWSSASVGLEPFEKNLDCSSLRTVSLLSLMYDDTLITG